MTSIEKTSTICFIGSGNMAQAILFGLIDSGYPKQNIIVCSPSATSKKQIAELGLKLVTSDINAAIAPSDMVIYAAKPQQLNQVSQALHPTDMSNRVLVSVAAGLTTELLSSAFQGCNKVIRTMPNTPTLLKSGVTGIYATTNVTELQLQLVLPLFQSIGEVVLVDDESHMDIVTAIAGSGPAYFFLLSESMIEAGVKLGLSQTQARNLVHATANGAGKMLKQLNEDAASLRAKVTSPGGTTAAAMNSLIEDGIKAVVNTAVSKAYYRGQELAALASKDK